MAGMVAVPSHPGERTKYGQLDAMRDAIKELKLSTIWSAYREVRRRLLGQAADSSKFDDLRAWLEKYAGAGVVVDNCGLARACGCDMKDGTYPEFVESANVFLLLLIKDRAAPFTRDFSAGEHALRRLKTTLRIWFMERAKIWRGGGF